MRGRPVSRERRECAQDDVGLSARSQVIASDKILQAVGRDVALDDVVGEQSEAQLRCCRCPGEHQVRVLAQLNQQRRVRPHARRNAAGNQPRPQSLQAASFEEHSEPVPRRSVKPGGGQAGGEVNEAPRSRCGQPASARRCQVLAALDLFYRDQPQPLYLAGSKLARLKKLANTGLRHAEPSRSFRHWQQADRSVWRSIKHCAYIIVAATGGSQAEGNHATEGSNRGLSAAYLGLPRRDFVGSYRWYKGTMNLSSEYDAELEAMLARLGATPGVEPAVLTAFWPRIGSGYSSGLMVVGRAVNGWIDEIAAPALADAAARADLRAAMRRTAEADGQCPMRWVTDAWGRPGGYSTARSAFWRHVRTVLAALEPGSAGDPQWSGHLAWSNLAKIAPADGGNPGGPLLQVQREMGPALLAREIAELNPSRVLVLTGRWWFEAFAERLGLAVDWQDGLVEGTADDGSRRWVIAPHPQGKPSRLPADVIAAFERSCASAPAGDAEV